MKPTIRTRLCRSRPLPDLNKMTLMFSTLIAQYLNKLIEGKVRHLAAPKPFHAIKVQRFKDNRIKLFTELGSQLPMPIFALVSNLSVEAGELTDTSPPPPRSFLFSRKAFVESAEFVQGVLYLKVAGVVFSHPC